MIEDDTASTDAVAPTAPTLSPQDRDAVIRTVIGEAGDQGDAGQAAVAAVIKNRHQAGFADTPSGVVFQRGQFEPWMHANTSQRLRSIDPDSPQYLRAASVVDNIWSGKYDDPTKGATHFYAPVAQHSLGRNDPSWSRTFTPTAQIGGHNFYQDPQYKDVLKAEYTGEPMPVSTDSPSPTPGSRRTMDTSNPYGTGATPAPPQDHGAFNKTMMELAYSPTNSPGWGQTFMRMAALLAGRVGQDQDYKGQTSYNQQLARILQPDQNPAQPVQATPSQMPMPRMPQLAPTGGVPPSGGQPSGGPVSPAGGVPGPSQSSPGPSPAIPGPSQSGSTIAPQQGGPAPFIPPVPGLAPLASDTAIRALLANPATRDKGLKMQEDRLEALKPEKIVTADGHVYVGNQRTGYHLSQMPGAIAPTLVDGAPDIFGNHPKMWANPQKQTLTPATVTAPGQQPGQAPGTTTGPTTPTTLNDFNAILNSKLEGKDLLKALDPITGSQVTAMIEGREGVGNAARGTPRWSMMVALAHKIDPTFDDSVYDTRKAMRKNSEAGGKDYTSIENANSVFHHIEQLSDMAQKQGNFQSVGPFGLGTKSANDLRTWGRAQQGDSDLTNFEGIRDLAVKEVEKFYLSTGGSKEERENAASRIKAANTPQQLDEIIAQTGHAMTGKIEEIDRQWRKTMGESAKPLNVLAPKSIEVLKKIDERAARWQKPDASKNNGEGKPAEEKKRLRWNPKTGELE